MMTVVIGGSKCGKSGYAEKILDSFDGKKLYIATMIPYGKEAHTAIERHREMRRNKGFETIEKYTALNEIVLSGKCAVLLECMGNLLANEMFSNEKNTNPIGKILSGVESLNTQAEQLVIVTNNIACDGISYESGTMEYIRNMGEINRCLCETADNVIECVYGIPLDVKGKLR